MTADKLEDIAIYGAGGFGMEVAWLIEDINRKDYRWNLLGFLDDDRAKWGREYYGYRALGGQEYLSSSPGHVNIAVAIGSPSSRQAVVHSLSGFNVSFPVLIHPSVIMSRSVVVSEGVIVAAGSVLTVEIQIGAHVHIDTSCTIGHETVIGSFVRLNPSSSVAGNVILKDFSYVGSNATIIQGLTIGCNTTIGAGAVVVGDLPDNVVAVGNPAKVIRSNEQPGVGSSELGDPIPK